MTAGLSRLARLRTGSVLHRESGDQQGGGSPGPRPECRESDEGPAATVRVRASRLRSRRSDDLSFEGDTVSVIFSAGIDRPLRLTSTEATVLLIALRSLAEMPGMVDRRPRRARSRRSNRPRAVRRDEKAPAATTCGGRRRSGHPGEPGGRNVRDALQHDRALRLTYTPPRGRAHRTRRRSDPFAALDDHTYLQGWCRQAEGVRLFDSTGSTRRSSWTSRRSRPRRHSGRTSTSSCSVRTAISPGGAAGVRAHHGWILENTPSIPFARCGSVGRGDDAIRLAGMDGAPRAGIRSGARVVDLRNW